MSWATSLGWETIATRPDGISMVVAHALGELALGVGRDRLIVLSDQVPGWV
jgi:hypothetical protein